MAVSSYKKRLIGIILSQNCFDLPSEPSDTEITIIGAIQIYGRLRKLATAPLVCAAKFTVSFSFLYSMTLLARGGFRHEWLR